MHRIYELIAINHSNMGWKKANPQRKHGLKRSLYKIYEKKNFYNSYKKIAIFK